MGGRALLRRGPATSLAALALAAMVVLLPALGSPLAPSPVITAGGPVAAVVHLLADEVLPAPPGPSYELRARFLAPDDLLLVAVLLALVTGLLGVTALVERARRMAVDRSVLLVTAASGRAPPRSSSHR